MLACWLSMLEGVIMGRPEFEDRIVGLFLNGCVDIEEIGRMHDAEIKKITIEGVYEGEIFRLVHTPVVEEDYDEGK